MKVTFTIFNLTIQFPIRIDFKTLYDCLKGDPSDVGKIKIVVEDSDTKWSGVDVTHNCHALVYYPFLFSIEAKQI